MWTDTTRAHHARAGLALPSDLTDAEWAVLEPFFPPPSHVGRPRKWPMRADCRGDPLSAARQPAVADATDSETAANRYDAALAASADRQKAWADAAIAADQAALRFARGEDDRIQMLDSRSVALQAQQSALIARADGVTAYVAFCKSLDGGAATQNQAAQ